MPNLYGKDIETTNEKLAQELWVAKRTGKRIERRIDKGFDPQSYHKSACYDFSFLGTFRLDKDMDRVIENSPNL